MSRTQGLGLALASVILVSGAQLGLRWSMTRLPTPAHWLPALHGGGLDPSALAGLSAGVLAYALSMLCWMGALRHLPLGRAYALLSISYALVHLGAALFPAFGESMGLYKTIGVGLVICGVLLIHARPAPPLKSTSRQEKNLI